MFAALHALVWCFALPAVYAVVTEAPAPSKVYAIVFPQYHSDPLNDKLWGANYTDWSRLQKAPKFNKLGQHIVRPTAEFGYYDLTQYDIRKKHATLAKEYDIDGFLYYHYWWNQQDPKVALHTPLEKMLLDGEPDIPFAFIWVRAPWSCTWQGQGNDTRYKANQMLVEVKCPPITDPIVTEHYEFLKRFFHHKNHILINGAPLFLLLDWKVNRQCDDIISHLRNLAIQDGFPAPGLHIARVKPLTKSEIYGPNYGKNVVSIDHDQLANAAIYYPYSDLNPNTPLRLPDYCFENRKTPWKKTLYMTIMAAFDNTPRRKFKTASIYKRNYTRHGPIKDFSYDFVQMMMYEQCCQDPVARGKGGEFVVINAWNEWGEGNVLEPTDITGYMYIKAVQKARHVVKRLRCDWDALKRYNAHYFDPVVAAEPVE